MGIEIKEIVKRLENKTVVSNGSIYEMFGTKYVAIGNNKCDDPCERCAFNNCACMFNVDIPSCNNDVHFEVIKDIKFGLYDVYNDFVDVIKKIDKNIVETECGEKFTMKTLYMNQYCIKPMLIK